MELCFCITLFNVKAWQVQRGIGTITLSPFPGLAFHGTTAYKKKQPLLPSKPFASPKPLLASTSVSESARKRFRNPQTKWVKHPELWSINSSKTMQWGISTAEELWNLHWSKVWDLFSNNRGKKKRFSRAKDQHYANHYDKQAFV